MEFAKILKANPYHDEKGRFSSEDKAKFVSTGGVFDKQRANAKDKEDPNPAQGADAAKWHNKDGSRKLPSLNPFSSIDTPLPRPKDGEVTAYHVRQPGDALTAVENAPVSMVKVADLVTGQQPLDADRLRVFEKDAPPVQVMIYQGVKYLTQGNHRAAAAWAANAKEIKAQVLDLDDPKNRKYLKPKYRPTKKSAFSY